VVETDPTITISTSGLVSSYPATVHYWRSGAAKTATSYGTWSIEVDRGSLVSIDSTLAVSSTERYSTNAATSWTANQTATYAVPYHHQYKTDVSVATAGTGHTDLDATNYVALTYYQFGSAVVSNLFDAQRLNDWVDGGSTASLASLSSGSTSTHRWYCPQTTSWTISSASSHAVMYWDQLKPSISVTTAGVGHTDLDATNCATLAYLQSGSARTLDIFDSQNFNDWVDAGSTASLSGTSSGSTSNHRWYGPEACSRVVSDANSSSVTYYEQFQLTVSVVPSNATSASGSGWYEEGEGVNLVVPDLVHSGGGVRYVFASWSVGGRQVNTRSISVRLDTPQSAEATYITQYYLDVQSVRGNPRGSGWYKSGSEVTISVESPTGTIVRQVFSKWDGDSTANTRDASVLMNGPRTVEALWRTDYTRLYILVTGILLVALVALTVIILALGRQRQKRPQVELAGTTLDVKVPKNETASWQGNANKLSDDTPKKKQSRIRAVAWALLACSAATMVAVIVFLLVSGYLT
jgi:hypothetical protein